MATQKEVIVIGGGHNGLTVAALLARQGKKVLLLEQAQTLGGVCQSWEFFKSSAGVFKTGGVLPTLETLNPEVNRILELGLTSDPKGDFRRIGFFGNEGRSISWSLDLRETQASLEKISAKDAKALGEYREWLKKISPFIAKVFSESSPHILDLSFSNLLGMASLGIKLRALGKKDMMELIRVAPMCVADFLNEWFETPFLKAALSLPATMGSYSGPWSPGNTFNLLVWESLSQTQVRNTSAQLIEKLREKALSLGVEIRTGASVSKVLIQENQARGVILANGEEIFAGSIFSSVHPKTLFQKLIHPSELPVLFSERIGHFRSRATQGFIAFALKGTNPLKDGVVRGRVADHLDEVERAFDPVKYREVSTEPTLSFTVPSEIDSALAPAGHSVLTALIDGVPYMDAEKDSKIDRTALIKNTLRSLKRAIPDIESRVVGHEVLTPYDLEKRLGLWGGHLLHGEFVLDQVLMRPSPECLDSRSPIKGLYLCGSGSHGGVGVSGTPALLAVQNAR